MPPPRAHLAGTLSTLDRLARFGGSHAALTHVRAFIDRPDALPVEVAPEDASLKYDLYVTRASSGTSWGIATADRYETATFATHARALAVSVGLEAAFDRAMGLRERLGDSSLVVAVALGRDARFRLKLYFQELAWDRGVTDVRALAEPLAAITSGTRMPAWIGQDRTIGVVCLDLHLDGTVAPKVYLGAASGSALSAGAPREVVELVDALETTCPTPGYRYLTLRLSPASEPRYAINKIYDHVSIGFRGDTARLQAAWREIEGLFRHAKQSAALEEARALVEWPRVRVVPTAIALEDGGASVDVYFGVWRTEADPG
jgi:hypothetical protein